MRPTVNLQPHETIQSLPEMLFDSFELDLNTYSIK